MRCSMRTERRTGKQAERLTGLKIDMTKLIIAFRNFPNALDITVRYSRSHLTLRVITFLQIESQNDTRNNDFFSPIGNK